VASEDQLVFYIQEEHIFLIEEVSTGASTNGKHFTEIRYFITDSN